MNLNLHSQSETPRFEWRPTTKYKIPHKCAVGNHWFWGRGVYFASNYYSGPNLTYRCETCHASQLLAGESK